MAVPVVGGGGRGEEAGFVGRRHRRQDGQHEGNQRVRA